MVKNPPAMQETPVWSLEWEDPLEKEMAIHSRILVPGRLHGQKSQRGYSSWGPGHDLVTEHACVP